MKWGSFWDAQVPHSVMYPTFYLHSCLDPRVMSLGHMLGSKKRKEKESGVTFLLRGSLLFSVIKEEGTHSVGGSSSPRASQREEIWGLGLEG